MVRNHLGNFTDPKYIPAMLPVPKLKFSEPRHNLPGRKGVATAEDRFTIAFARAYSEKAVSLHAGSLKTEMAVAREIPVPGFGIADLLAVSWNPDASGAATLDEFVDGSGFTSRAFEVKLDDWKSGLSQATRYRFFAHQSILVLPPATCERALVFIDTFTKVRIGLWSFDAATGRITAFHTPRALAPKSPRSHRVALEKMNRAARQALPIG